MSSHGWLRKNACSVVLVQSNLALQRSNCISCIFERRKAGETCKTCSRDQSANSQDHYINNAVIMLNEINERKPGAAPPARNYKFRRQNFVLRAIFFCMVTALSIYFVTAAAHWIRSGATHFAMVQSTNSAGARSVAYSKFLNGLIRSVFRLGKLLFKPTY